MKKTNRSQTTRCYGDPPIQLATRFHNFFTDFLIGQVGARKRGAARPLGTSPQRSKAPVHADGKGVVWVHSTRVSEISPPSAGTIQPGPLEVMVSSMCPAGDGQNVSGHPAGSAVFPAQQSPSHAAAVVLGWQKRKHLGSGVTAKLRRSLRRLQDEGYQHF